jgi:prevent-host-death family protein
MKNAVYSSINSLWRNIMVNLAQDLKPISYVKAHTTEVVKYVGDSKAPVVITQNGEAKAVIIDIESYQKTLNAISLAKLLSFGEKDIKRGNVIPHEDAKRIFEKTLGRKRP